MSCYTEREIAQKAIEVIRSNPGIRTSELIDKLRSLMQPSGDDLSILNDRNDDKFSQKVRNIKSHDSIAHIVKTVGDHNRQWFIDE